MSDKKDGKNWTETVLLAVVFAAVFAAVFFLSQSAGKQEESTFEGLRVFSNGDAKAEMAAVLAPNNATIEERLFNGSDSRNSAVAVMAAEIARALHASKKGVSVYGVVDGVASINCNATNNCSGSTIVVEISNCDCLRVSDRIYVSGGKDFMLQNAQKIAGIIAYVLQPI